MKNIPELTFAHVSTTYTKQCMLCEMTTLILMRQSIAKLLTNFTFPLTFHHP